MKLDHLVPWHNGQKTKPLALRVKLIINALDLGSQTWVLSIICIQGLWVWFSTQHTMSLSDLFYNTHYIVLGLSHDM